VSFRRSLGLAALLALAGQALTLGAYYVGTAGCACATLTVGGPAPARHEALALRVALAAEPLMAPAAFVTASHPVAEASHAIGQFPGALGVWGPDLLSGLFNATVWASLLAPGIWLLDAGRRSARRWRMARRAV
jgi:hypothetical protein